MIDDLLTHSSLPLWLSGGIFAAIGVAVRTSRILSQERRAWAADKSETEKKTSSDSLQGSLYQQLADNAMRQQQNADTAWTLVRDYIAKIGELQNHLGELQTKFARVEAQEQVCQGQVESLMADKQVYETRLALAEAQIRSLQKSRFAATDSELGVPQR